MGFLGGPADLTKMANGKTGDASVCEASRVLTPFLCFIIAFIYQVYILRMYVNFILNAGVAV